MPEDLTNLMTEQEKYVFLQIIDEWHREYFLLVQNFDTEDVNAENSDILSVSEDEESMKFCQTKKIIITFQIITRTKPF